MHRPENILFRRLAHGVLLIVSQDDHVIPLVTEIFVQKRRHVLHVIDTTPQLASLAEIVDSDQQSLPSSCAIRVLERIALWRSIPEALHARGGWRWSTWIAIYIEIRIDRWRA